MQNRAVSSHFTDEGTKAQEGRELSQIQTVGKWASQNTNPILSIPKAHVSQVHHVIESNLQQIKAKRVAIHPLLIYETFVIFIPKFRFPASKNNDDSITEEFQVLAARRKGNPESSDY